MKAGTTIGGACALARNRREVALLEVLADLDDVAWLAATARRRLAAARRASAARRRAFRARTLATYLAQAVSAERALSRYEEEALEVRARAAAGGRRWLGRAEVAHRNLSDVVRMQVGVAAALAAAADWQSPPFGGTLVPGAGRMQRLVTEHRDDYKRDRHRDGAAVEAAFAHHWARLPSVGARLTGCGMAAFTTILALLEREGRARRALAGRGLYHESRMLLGASALERVVDVDENDPDAIVAGVRDGDVLFLDSLCNSRGLRACDLARLLPRLAARDATVVLDTTCTSVCCCPFALLPAGAALRLIAFESLTKYGQFGLDRTPAGLILGRARDCDGIDDVREHVGTNIGDVAALTIPAPDPPRLRRRLRRIERNATLVAAAIEAQVRERGAVGGAVYPGLPRHPSHAAARRGGFAGGLVSVWFAAGLDRPEVHGELVERIVDECRRRGVPVAVGASFGFDVTRVYRTAVASELGPFVRIAPGIEHAAGAPALAAAVAAACRSL